MDARGKGACEEPGRTRGTDIDWSGHERGRLGVGKAGRVGGWVEEKA